MKKIIFAMLMLAPVYVHAAEKCVKLDPSEGAICSTDYSKYDFKSDWEATCPESNGIPVRGIGVCAKTSGKEGDVIDDLEFSADASENIYCWCKMVSPAVSRWAFKATKNYISSAICAAYCANYCAQGLWFPTYAPVRRALFSNLKD